MLSECENEVDYAHIIRVIPIEASCSDDGKPISKSCEPFDV